MTSPAEPPDSLPRCVTASIDESAYTRVKNAREIVQKALDDRRDKAWRIFSWSSSVLLAIAGGAIALFGERGSRFAIWPHGVILISATVVLSTYACLWINQNQRLADNAGDIVAEYDRLLGIDTGYRKGQVVIGYVATVVLLAVAAALSIVVTAQYSATTQPAAAGDAQVRAAPDQKVLEG